MKLGRVLRFLALPAALAVLPACTIEPATPFIGGYATMYASTVPPDIATYPRVWYSDRFVYLVGDQWYAPQGRSWVVLRREPPVLQQYRMAYRPRPPAAWIAPGRRPAPAFRPTPQPRRPFGYPAYPGPRR
jgi:hypothetical protein